MKILQINAVYNLSSTGRTCSELQNYINKNTEHECKTAFCYGGEEKDGFIIGNKTDRKIHSLMSRISGEQGHFSKNATKELLSFIEEYKPDIVHLRNLHGNYIHYPMLFKYLSDNKIATVATLHDCWFFTGKCMHYTALKCDEWQKECGNCPNIKEGNTSWFFDKTQKLLKEKISLFASLDKYAITGVSDWTVSEVLKSQVGQNANIVKRIYNWIDLDLFKPIETNKRKDLAFSDDDFIILGVMNNWGSDYLKEMVELSYKLKDNQKLLLVGNVNSNIELNGNIISVGATSNISELVEYYNMADVFVSVSKQETFGKVSAEALSCGTPIICYNSTACPELVGEGCGYVCEPNDIDQVYEAVLKVKQNTKAFYSENCVKHANQNFNKEVNICDYIDLYRNLLLFEKD